MFVFTVVPQLKATDLCTPSLETSAPALPSDLAETLSISSKKTIPLFSAANLLL